MKVYIFLKKQWWDNYIKELPGFEMTGLMAKNRSKTRISIGSTFARWLKLKDEKRLESQAEVELTCWTSMQTFAN